MFKKILTYISVILLMASLNIDTLAGGGKRNATAGAQELLIPVSARGLAMSGAYNAGLSGLDAIFYNPAGLGLSQVNTEAMFSYMNYIADIGFAFAGVAVHSESLGSLGFTIRTFDFGDIPVTTTQNPYGTGATFSPTYVIVGATYANALTDRIHVGFTINVISEQIMRVSASGIGFDAGVQYNGVAGIEGLQFGVAVKNLGPQMKFAGADLIRTATDPDANRGNQRYLIDAASFELPSQLELGLAYEKRFADQYKALFTTTFQNNNFSNDEYRFAAEFTYNDLLFVRGGYTYVSEAAGDEEQFLFGPTFGAGLQTTGNINVKVDYAYRSARYFDANHMVTVTFGF